MKKLFLFLFLTFSASVNAQDSFDQLYADKHETKIDLHLDMVNTSFTTTSTSSTKTSRGYGYNESSFPLGVGMMLGGAVFITAGALTTPVYEGGSTTVKKPFIQQPYAWPILSGAAVLLSGVVVSFSF